MITVIAEEDGTLFVANKGDMVITIPASEKEYQLHHLDQLEPNDQAAFDEITTLLDKVNGKKPKLVLRRVK